MPMTLPLRCCRLVDGLFLQLYKPNMRLLPQPHCEGAQELQQVHKASNRHAAFVLHIG